MPTTARAGASAALVLASVLLSLVFA